MCLNEKHGRLKIKLSHVVNPSKRKIESYVHRIIKEDTTKLLIKMLKCSKFQINPNTQNSGLSDISDPLGYFHQFLQP
jgi:hypothetical protein